MNKHWPNRKTKWGTKRRIKKLVQEGVLESVVSNRKGLYLMKKFWELVRDSVIVQGIVTVAFVGTVCYLYVTGQEVPSTLIQFTSGVIGYFFGAKQLKAAGR